MHVFIVGATGVLGHTLIPRLIQSGYRVTGLGRSPEKLCTIERLGGGAVRGDILDGSWTRRLLLETMPDIVVNLATAIPRRLKIDPAEWEMNDRIRTQGTCNLLDACDAARVSLLVQESVGYVCAPCGSKWIGEDSPRSSHSFLRATVEMEDLIRASRVPSVILRLAALMSLDAWHTQQMVAALRRGMLPIVGSSETYMSLIHAEDAASAIVNAVDRPDAAAGNIYNIVDDAPAPIAEVLSYAARSLHAPAPKRIAPFLARLAVGSLTLEILGASYRMSNAKVRAHLAFAPRYPTFVESWDQIANAM